MSAASICASWCADKPGVLAEIAAAMRDAGVSIESVIQRGAHEDGSVLLVVVTHDSSERAIARDFEDAERI
jgi:homoserine dehydrogenase